MKKVWKWIIGIVLGLIVLAVLVGMGFMAHANFRSYRFSDDGGQGFSQRGGPGMMPYGGFDHFRGPAGMGPGMMGRGFNPLGGLIGGLFSLAFLALAVMGVIWLVNRLRTPKPVTVTPVAMPVQTPALITDPCKRCSYPLQADWKVCPNCGRKV
jgi:hypothetical protein